MSYVIQLDKTRYLHISAPIQVLGNNIDGHSIDLPELEIQLHHNNLQLLMADFAKYIRFLYKEFILADDDSLRPSAVEYKLKLQQYIKLSS